MRKLSSAKIRKRENILDIARRNNHREQMLTESVNAGLNRLKDKDRQLIETYVREAILFGSERDEALVERVDQAVAGLIEMVDVSASLRSTAERTGNSKLMMNGSGENFLEEGDASYDEMMFRIEKLHEDIDAVITADLQEGLSEGGESMILDLFSAKKKANLLEGVTEENLTESDEDITRASIKSAKLFMILENLDIRLKEGTTAKDVDDKFLSILIQ